MSLRADLLAALDPVALFEAAFGLPALPMAARLPARDPAHRRPQGSPGRRQPVRGRARHPRALYWPDTNVVIVSPSLKQSTEIATSARAGLRPLGVRLVQDSTSTLRLANGSRILSLPGTARSVRGWTARLLILDEAAFIAPETFTAARALVATGGRIVVQSTPADEYGDFYELCTGDDPAWSRLTVRSDEVPTISAEFLDAERRAMGPDAMPASTSACSAWPAHRCSRPSASPA